MHRHTVRGCGSIGVSKQQGAARGAQPEDASPVKGWPGSGTPEGQGKQLQEGAALRLQNKTRRVEC